MQSRRSCVDALFACPAIAWRRRAPFRGSSRRAAAVGVIVKKRFLLSFATAMGCLFLAAAPAFGQNSTNGPAVTTSSANQSLYDAYLTASTTTGSNSAKVWFEWGLTINYGQLTPPIAIESTNATSISNLILGLTPYTTYHYQAVASNVFGTVLGGDVSFTTVPRFVQVGTNTGWSAFVMSGDGHELVATMNGIIYISTNLGGDFTATAGVGSVVAISFNGSNIVAANGASLCVSTNGGSIWFTNNTPVSFTNFSV